MTDTPEDQTAIQRPFEEAIEDHKWLMRHCDLLRERFDRLPPWALIRQHRILAEWDIALDRAGPILKTLNRIAYDEEESG